jgi:hypothetical protein
LIFICWETQKKGNKCATIAKVTARLIQIHIFLLFSNFPSKIELGALFYCGVYTDQVADKSGANLFHQDFCNLNEFESALLYFCTFPSEFSDVIEIIKPAEFCLQGTVCP